MYEKFGEFDSWEEINRAAQAQLEEGDLEAVKAIAEENGLDKEDAEDFCTGTIDTLTTPLLAALGKIQKEVDELNVEGILGDWADSVVKMCDEDEEMALAVRKKGKSLQGFLSEILREAFKTKKRVDDRIVRGAKLNPPLYLGIPGKAEVRKMAEKYYKG